MCRLTNKTQDWPLINQLWTGWLPQDVDMANRAKQMEETYWTFSEELHVLLPPTSTSPNLWVDAPLLVAHTQLLVDVNHS